MFWSCCVTSTHHSTAEHVNIVAETIPENGHRSKQEIVDEEEPVNFDGTIFECLLPICNVGRVGLEVEAWSRALQVIQLGNAVEDYNYSAPPERQIQVNDFIVNVNGSAGVKSMEDKLQRRTEEEEEVKDTLTLTIARPTRIYLPPIQKSESYGCKLSYKRGATLMNIVDMVSGGVAKYNATVSPRSQVQPGDFIVDVNGTSGSAEQMHDILKAAVAAELTILKVPIMV